MRADGYDDDVVDDDAKTASFSNEAMVAFSFHAQRHHNDRVCVYAHAAAAAFGAYCGYAANVCAVRI